MKPVGLAPFPKIGRIVMAMMSSFVAKKLDIFWRLPDSYCMDTVAPMTHTRRIAHTVRKRIDGADERVWRLDDFSDLPFMAVAQALSRLTKEGVIERLSKGVYFRARSTVFGSSKPNPSVVQKLASRRSTVFPSGVAAANMLGFSTQTASRGEIATSALSLPRKLVGKDTIIHARRPVAWRELSDRDAALLDFLRRRGSTSELTPKDTVKRLLSLLSDGGCFERLLKVADTEPPRVRALLGAIGEQLGRGKKSLERLRASLNPFSKFDFGALAGLPYARHWQASERR
jgi:hypothetical protein